MVKCEEFGCQNEAVEKVFTKYYWPNGTGLPLISHLRLCDHHARIMVDDYTGPDTKPT